MNSFDYKEGRLEFLSGNPVVNEGGAVFYCTKGSATLHIEGTSYNVREASVALLLPQLTLQISQASNDFHAILWSFSHEMFIRLNNRFSPTFYHVVVANPVFNHQHGSDDAEYVRLSLQLVRLVIDKKATPHSEMRLCNMAENLVTCVADWAVPFAQQGFGQDATCDRKRTLYRQFITDVCHYCKTEHNIDFYCDKLCISRRYLSQIVHDCNPKYTPQQIIIEHLNFKIKRALMGTDKTISQIADEFKFQTQSNFSAFFIRNNQISPTEFRNQER